MSDGYGAGNDWLARMQTYGRAETHEPPGTGGQDNDHRRGLKAVLLVVGAVSAAFLFWGLSASNPTNESPDRLETTEPSWERQ